MPDGPLAAAIVLVAGLVLLGIGYMLTEGIRPGRSRRHRRESERLPLFGTDQLVVRRYPVEEPSTEQADEEESTDAQPALRPAPRPEPRAIEPHPPHAPHLPPATHPPRAERSNGRHETTPPSTPVVEPPRPIAPAARRPEAPIAPPPATPRHAPIRPPAERGADDRSFSWPPLPGDGGPAPRIATQSRPTPRVPAPVAGGDAAFVDGETLRFAVPTDRTLQFLPGRLEVIAGPDTGREVRFVRTPGEDTVQVTFGRAEGPVYRHVQLHARTVSRQHAMMSLIDEHWELRNLSMTNPVVLNGRVLEHNEVAPLLVEGDKIEMGEVVFLFHER
jgi:hypothetical protein